MSLKDYGYRTVNLKSEYVDKIIREIQKFKPELKSNAKVIEFALQLFLMQLRGEIIRIPKKEIDKLKKELAKREFLVKELKKLDK